MNKQRPTIAFLSDFYLGDYQTTLHNAIESAARARDINLLCIIGRSVDSPLDHDKVQNEIYNDITSNAVSGIIFLVVALVLGVAGFILFMNLEQMQLLLPLLLLPIVIWLVGAHRILWGGTAPVNRWLSAGRVVVTTVIGYLSLMIISGLVGAIIALVEKSA